MTHLSRYINCKSLERTEMKNNDMEEGYCGANIETRNVFNSTNEQHADLH